MNDDTDWAGNASDSQTVSRSVAPLLDDVVGFGSLPGTSL